MKKKASMLQYAIAILSLSVCIGNDLIAQKSITFYADISEPMLEDWMGHVWVGFNDGKSEEIFGFYPDGLSDDSWRHGDVNYTFEVSDEAYAEALKVVEDFQKSTYITGLNDCRNFAYHVARTIGLRAPSTGLKSPAEWLGELVSAN